MPSEKIKLTFIVQIAKRTCPGSNMNILHVLFFLPPATKLGQGYIFTGVCDSVHGGVPGPAGGCLVLGGASPGVCLLPRGCLLGGGSWWRPPGTATAAGGTHPTRMHSCFII